MITNDRSRKVFEDRDTEGLAFRSLTFDEATFVSMAVNHVARRTGNAPRPISLGEFLDTVGMLADLPDPSRYVRPVYEFVQRIVATGALAELALPLEHSLGDLSSRLYRIGIAKTIQEHIATDLAASVLGIPYVAHRYGDIAVRIHSYDVNGTPNGIGSGVVLGQGLVVTNRHVVENGVRITVSWQNSSEVEIKAKKIHPNDRIDLAVIAVESFVYYPHVWIRDPQPAEDVVIIAHPNVPQVETRPTLSFTGTVASTNYVTTYYGVDQTIISSVMGPGASGGPVFGRDGQLVGIVVQLLEGLYMDGRLQPSIFHAIVPGEILLRELPKLHPIFRFKNKFATSEEGARAVEEWSDKWWICND